MLKTGSPRNAAGRARPGHGAPSQSQPVPSSRRSQHRAGRPRRDRPEEADSAAGLTGAGVGGNGLDGQRLPLTRPPPLHESLPDPPWLMPCRPGDERGAGIPVTWGSRHVHGSRTSTRQGPPPSTVRAHFPLGTNVLGHSLCHPSALCLWGKGWRSREPSSCPCLREGAHFPGVATPAPGHLPGPRRQRPSHCLSGCSFLNLAACQGPGFAAPAAHVDLRVPAPGGGSPGGVVPPPRRLLEDSRRFRFTEGRPHRGQVGWWCWWTAAPSDVRLPHSYPGLVHVTCV